MTLDFKALKKMEEKCFFNGIYFYLGENPLKLVKNLLVEIIQEIYRPSNIFIKFFAAIRITLTVFIRVSILVPAEAITNLPAFVTTR